MRRLLLIPLLLLAACSLPDIPLMKGGLWGKSAQVSAEQPAAADIGGAIKTPAPIGQTAPTKVVPRPAIPAAPNASQVPISPEEAACRAKGGQWAKAGKLAAMTCYIPSKDAGKSCTKQSDCSSQCLARSKTCAPIWPIFGCSEVLQNDGALVKLCID